MDVRAVALLVVTACAHPHAEDVFATRPAPSVGHALELTEADGTEWLVRTEKGVAEPDHESTPHILLRRPRGAASAIEVTRVQSGGWIQENPTMAGGTEWRFYIGSDGKFRAAQQTSSMTGHSGQSTTTTMVFRFDGTQLVPE